MIDGWVDGAPIVAPVASRSDNPRFLLHDRLSPEIFRPG
jgi:hypothetical protein